jgi:hypothetical protein
VDAYIHVFLTSAVVGDEWSASHPGLFTPRERAPCVLRIGGWLGPRAGLDDVGKGKLLALLGLELHPLGRPARSQSLYRLRLYNPHSTRKDRTWIACSLLAARVRDHAWEMINSCSLVTLYQQLYNIWIFLQNKEIKLKIVEVKVVNLSEVCILCCTFYCSDRNKPNCPYRS